MLVSCTNEITDSQQPSENHESNSNQQQVNLDWVRNIQWLGDLSSFPSNPEEGYAFFNTVDGYSYVYVSNQGWTKIAKTTVLSYQGSMSSAPSNPSVGWIYYDTAQLKSFIWDGSTWGLIATDGKNGSDGTDGTAAPSDKWFLLKEENTVYDGVTYKAQHYVDLPSSSPCLYDYYILYYLNGKLRIIDKYYESVMNPHLVAYDSLMEHLNNCPIYHSRNVSFYSENGTRLKFIQYSNAGGLETSNTYSIYYYYPSGTQFGFCSSAGTTIQPSAGLYNEDHQVIWYASGGTAYDVNSGTNTSMTPEEVLAYIEDRFASLW